MRRSRGATIIVLALWAAACSDSTLPDGAAPSVRTEGSVPAPDSSGDASADLGAGGDPATASSGGDTGVEGSGPPASTASAGPSPSGGATATGGGSTVGVTDNTITISASGIWSGPYGALTNKQFDNGFMTWVSEVNAKGGIHGRRIVVKKVDNMSTPEGAVAACKEEKTNGTFIVVGLGSSLPGETDCLDQAGMPALMMVAERDPETWRVVRAIESQPSNGVAMASFAKAHLGAGTKKVGVIVTQMSATISAAGRFAQTAKEIGVDVVATEKIEQNQGSVVAELSRLRSAGAEVVVLHVLTEVLTVLRDARAIGYQPVFTGVVWTVDDLSQVARELMSGIKGLRFTGTSSSAAFKAYTDEAARQGKRNASTTDARLYGVGQVLGHVLEAAGPNLTREAFVDAIDRTKGFDGGIIQPVSWNPPDRIGTRAQFPVQCCNPDWTWKGLGPAQERF